MDRTTSDTPIYTFEKNSKEEVRVTVGEFHGRQIMNFRVFYKDKADNWLPGKQGIALSVERYRDLAEAVVKLGEWLKSNNVLK